MCKMTGRPQLFRRDFYSDNNQGEIKPREFGFLIRPTSKEFYSFALLLDKMLSDNINKDFFQKEIPYEREETRKDGKIVLTQKGTIQLLDEWLKKSFRPTDWTPLNNMIESLKSIRKLRQPPAHNINDNIFNYDYIHQQRELILKAYESVRLLRLIFTNHPKVINYKISDQLKEGKIWHL